MGKMGQIAHLIQDGRSDTLGNLIKASENMNRPEVYFLGKTYSMADAKQILMFMKDEERKIHRTNSPLNGIQTATIDECASYCLSKDVLGVDTETEGFDFTSKKMIMLQIGDKERQYVIDTRVVDITPLKPILESHDIIKIFHNAKFDYKFIKQWAGISVEKYTIRFLWRELSIAASKTMDTLFPGAWSDTSVLLSIKRRVTNSSDSKVNLLLSTRLRTGQTMWFICWTYGRTSLAYFIRMNLSKQHVLKMR